MSDKKTGEDDGYKLTDEDRAKLAIIEWQESQNFKISSHLQENPIVAAGATGMFAIAAYRLLSFGRYKRKYKGNIDVAYYLINTRMAAQGFIVFSVGLWAFVNVAKHWRSKYLESQEKKEDGS